MHIILKTICECSDMMNERTPLSRTCGTGRQKAVFVPDVFLKNYRRSKNLEMSINNLNFRKLLYTTLTNPPT